MANPNPNEVFTGGATTSQHIEAEDDDHFNNTTFKLKRTRSLGLLDEFINPLEKAKKELEQQANERPDDEAEVSSVSDILEPTPNDSADKLSINTSVDDEHHANNEDIQKVSSPTFKSPEFMPHDDNDISIEPSIHVDYFSHQWDVSDISKSWRYIIQKRKDVANSSRLENASWRTWAQRRSNLKTINPEELNWSKESDITWLYGPIVQDDAESSDDENDHPDHENDESVHKQSKHKHSSNTATSKVAGDISIPSKHNKKGILKKRSVQDVMISHANLVKLEAMENRLKMKKEQQREQLKKQREELNKKKGHSRNNSNEPPEFDDYEAISEKLNSQYRVSSNQNSSVNLRGLNQAANENNDNDTKTDDNSNNNASFNVGSPDTKDDTINDSNIDGLSTKLEGQISNIDLNEEDDEPEETQTKKGRTIHFNDVVEQCMAVDDEYVYDSDLNTDLEDDDEYDYYPDSNSNQQSYIFSSNSNLNDDFDYEYEEDNNEFDEDDEDGGFFLKVKSNSSTAGETNEESTDKPRAIDRQSIDPSPPSQKTNDTDSISTTNSKAYRSIQLLPPTRLNYGSDEDSSDEDNPYTSSVSHNVNNSSSRGYDYYYDYNTVYTVDPTNGVYGSDKDNAHVPDVVDLPEELAPYSSYDSAADVQPDSLPILDSQVISNNNIIYNSQDREDSSLTSPVNQVPPSLPQPGQGGGFSFNDSESDSDSDESDEGLSISTKSSSQSLAQQAYQHMTPMGNNSHNEDDNKEDDAFSLGYNPAPILDTMNSINPRHSSTGLSKQSTSSNSLSNQFFGTTPLTKDPSSSALADSFFNTDSQSVPPLEKPLPSYPQRTHPKSSPLPPHTTSANAFSGNTTPPLEIQRKPSSTFAFDSSDSEDEFVEDVNDRLTQGSQSPVNANGEYSSYNSLSQVAGKSGISSSDENVREGKEDKNLVNQARGLATHFLGNIRK